jgi:ketosteroid isomerase-like protein
VDTGRYIKEEEGHGVAVGHTWGRVHATGREFGVPETHLWTVKAGKVVRFEAYIDRYLDDAWGARRALGCPGPSSATSSGVIL